MRDTMTPNAPPAAADDADETAFAAWLDRLQDDGTVTVTAEPPVVEAPPAGASLRARVAHAAAAKRRGARTLRDAAGAPAVLYVWPADDAAVEAARVRYLARLRALEAEGAGRPEGADAVAVRDALSAYLGACVARWTLPEACTPEAAAALLGGRPWLRAAVDEALHMTDDFSDAPGAA